MPVNHNSIHSKNSAHKDPICGTFCTLFITSLKLVVCPSLDESGFSNTLLANHNELWDGEAQAVNLQATQRFSTHSVA